MIAISCVNSSASSNLERSTESVQLGPNVLAGVCKFITHQYPNHRFVVLPHGTLQELEQELHLWNNSTGPKFPMKSQAPALFQYHGSLHRRYELLQSDSIIDTDLLHGREMAGRAASSSDDSDYNNDNLQSQPQLQQQLLLLAFAPRQFLSLRALSESIRLAVAHTLYPQIYILTETGSVSNRSPFHQEGTSSDSEQDNSSSSSRSEMANRLQGKLSAAVQQLGRWDARVPESTIIVFTNVVLADEETRTNGRAPSQQQQPQQQQLLLQSFLTDPVTSYLSLMFPSVIVPDGFLYLQNSALHLLWELMLEVLDKRLQEFSHTSPELFPEEFLYFLKSSSRTTVYHLLCHYLLYLYCCAMKYRVGMVNTESCFSFPTIQAAATPHPLWEQLHQDLLNLTQEWLRVRSKL